MWGFHNSRGTCQERANYLWHCVCVDVSVGGGEGEG